MTELTRAEAFAAIERGEEVEFNDCGTPETEWLNVSGMRVRALQMTGMRFRLKPEPPKRAREFWVDERPIYGGKMKQLNIFREKPNPAFGLIRLREVLPNDMTGREALWWACLELDNHKDLVGFHSALLAKRDSLPE